MLVVAFKPAHDGGVAVVEDGQLSCSLESEKDSNLRYSYLTPSTVLEVAERLGRIPDVVALGGWRDNGSPCWVGAGYEDPEAVQIRQGRFFGRPVKYFSSSHVRSHIVGALGMAPPGQRTDLNAVLVWEGAIGSFYLVDSDLKIVRTIPVMEQPGAKYAALFAICDPDFPAVGGFPRLSDSGKLMALAAFASLDDLNPQIRTAVDRMLNIPNVYPVPKECFRDTPLFDAGVTSTVCKDAAGVITKLIFEVFAEVAVREIPEGVPLFVSGGCGLNCDWNSRWVGLGHFASVFVPPCPNDSGSAIGTAIDAYATLTGDLDIDWDVYSGLEFVEDQTPNPSHWIHRDLDERALASALANGRVAAWVQGRWEIGPRALGNRSLLAEPTSPASRDRLNAIKQRETYRPIAPCVRQQDLASAFEEDFVDPFMLYFRKVRDPRLRAVTHVDGSARAQTVSATSNPPLHRLLTAVQDHTGVGVLCNTSLNFPGLGFINKMSDLVRYCDSRGVDDMIIGTKWFERSRTRIKNDSKTDELR
jgi:hydroxymethyl cephem carbamoyltransferase